MASSEDIKLAENSGFFNEQWYLLQYPDTAKLNLRPIEHYIHYGAILGRNPSPNFSTTDYVQHYPDVKKSGINPLIHYIKYGQKQGYSAIFLTPLVARANYNNFDQYLKFSLLSPLIQTPFTKKDKGSFVFMDKISRLLSSKVAEAVDLPLVSIIMPVHNRESLINRAITSVLSQTYEKFELIVIDDFSDDKTVEVVRSFTDKRVLLIDNGQKIGVSAARNKGLELAKGDLITYLDSDNTWLENFLLSMIGAFQTLPDADAAYCGQYLYRGNNPQPSAVRFGCYNPSLLANHNYIDLNCFVHTKKVLGVVGGFDEAMKRLVDWDLIWRISQSGKIYSIPVLESNYFYDAAQKTITKTENVGIAIKVLKTKIATSQQKNNPKDILTKKVTVVIPSYEAVENLKLCINSFRDYFHNPLVEIILVDNASSTQTVDYLRELETNGTKVIYNTYNSGFSYAVNQGVAVSEADSDILLLNNDAVLIKGALDNLQAVAHSHESIAISVPQQVLEKGTPTINTHVPYADSAIACDVTLSAHHDNVASLPLFHNGESIELNFAPFFCAYIKRDVWEKCGGLDAEKGRHYRSDRIMCEYVRHILGMKIIYTPKAIVRHYLQASTKALEAKTKDLPDNELIFPKNQWGKDVAKNLSFRKAPWDF